MKSEDLTKQFSKFDSIEEGSLLNKYVHVYECIQIVFGKYRCAFIDLNRKAYYVLPKDIGNLIHTYKNHKLISLVEKLNSNQKLEIINYLLDNEIIFLENNNLSEYFPKLSLEFKSLPLATIKIDFNTFLNQTKILNEAEQLGCKNLEIYFEREFNIEYLLFIDKSTHHSSIHNIIIYINSEIYSVNTEFISHWDNLNPRFFRCIFYNSKDTQLFSHESIINTKKPLVKLLNDSNNLSYFTPTINLYVESFYVNPFYFGSIYISERLKIKPSKISSINYGKYRQGSLQDLLNYKEYQKFINITKDKIPMCCDCEFRRICNDNREPKVNEFGNYYFDTPCKYDIQNGKWLD